MANILSSRKWLITINNPLEHGYTHDEIVSCLSSLRGSSLYWCLCDEIGDECETLHTHVFLFRSGAFTWQQIDSLFPGCHRDNCYGSTFENRSYILKDGEKFNKDSDGHYHYVDSSGRLHEGLNLSSTFLESGPCPKDVKGSSSSSEIIITMIKDGASNDDIVDAVPSSFKQIEQIERTRSMYRDKKFRSSWRDLHTTYIFGETGLGKTRSIMDKFGYECVYRVTDYKHPFDTYDGQDVLIFEEFRGGIKHGDMLNFLDGYPLLLPCRYFNRQACFTKVFIVSNLPPDQQYLNVDRSSREAFFRRIHEVIHFSSSGVVSYPSFDAFKHRSDWTYDIQNQVPEADFRQISF